MQSFELWHPTTDIPEYLSGAVVLQPGHNELFVICDGEFKNGKCLVLSFGFTEAFHVYDHAAYPQQYMKDSNEPQRPKSGEYTFPFLKVLNSNWAIGSSQTYLFDDTPTHYSVFSLTYCVDVLCSHEPTIHWVNPSDINALFDTVLAAANT